MNLREIVKDWLEKNGYEGLFSDSDCGCGVDDLMPCDDPNTQCEPGYKTPCPGPEECETGYCRDWHYGPERAAGAIPPPTLTNDPHDFEREFMNKPFPEEGKDGASNA